MTFSITGEAGKYRLTVAGYRGDAGDAMRIAHFSSWKANGKKFSTPDSDNDTYGGGRCATNAGWWFGECSSTKLNAVSSGSWSTGAHNTLNNVQASRMLVKFN